jgi:3-methyladenine DNA glycosylase AlkC
MAIYFLQRLNTPVLPILHEIISSKKLLDKKSISNKLNKLKKNYSSELTQTSAETNNNQHEQLKNIFNDSVSLKIDLDELEYDHDTIDDFRVFNSNLSAYVSIAYFKTYLTSRFFLNKILY